MKQHRLIILGASNAQLPIILKAVEMGFYVITIDNLPNNIGHQYSHQSANCSTVDLDGVCKIAKELTIDGIVTFASDVATTTVAFVAASLQLQGCKVKTAETLSNKANFRQFQQQHALNHPDFFIEKSMNGLEEKCLKLNPPLIFKPVDTSGSRGITKVEDINASNCREAFSYAQQFSNSGTVSVEEFVEGVDISGDGYLVSGQLYAVVSQKYKCGFIPTGHRFPTNISNKDQALIFSEIVNTCQALGYSDGPIDFDVKISNKQVIVIEMSPRLGGNGIPELIKYSTGVDLVKMTINYALGNPYSLPNDSHTKGCASWVFGNEIAGKIEHIASTKEMKDKIKELFECRLNYKLGEVIPAFEHSGNSLGYALFDCPSENDYNAIIMRLQSALQLSVI